MESGIPGGTGFEADTIGPVPERFSAARAPGIDSGLERDRSYTVSGRKGERIMSLVLYSEGGAQEVTGTRHFFESDGARIMIDCGAFQGREKDADARNRSLSVEPNGLDAVVLTHAHFDHSGLLPLLVKRGYDGPIYATPATRDLAGLILMDSAKIQARDAEYARKHRAEGAPPAPEPLYDERDVIRTLDRFISISYGREIAIAPGVSLRFFDAGHILGSSIAFFRVKTGDGAFATDIAFTGDLGRDNKPIIRDPARIPDVEYLVLESTYGNRLHEPVEAVMPRLAEVVNETVSRGGKLVIPSFAIGRTQELVFYLHLLRDNRMIPEVPTFVDSPMATNATAIFRIHPECYDEETYNAFTVHHRNPFGWAELRYIESTEDSKRLNSLEGPAIIIATDGMVEAGRILHHIRHTAADPRNTILAVGYMADGTLGRRIVERARTVRVFGDEIPLRARVEEIRALSGHADYEELHRFAARLDQNRLRTIFLVHGEAEVQREFREFLLSRGAAEVEIMKRGERFRLT